jgi:hypothetical protein
MFFFEKKNQKTFIRGFAPGGTRVPPGAKPTDEVFFASFFFRKKKILAFLISPKSVRV